MNYIDFDEMREFDIILLGRVGIDFNPAYSEDVKEDFKPLKNVHYFEKFVGGSPANIAVGITHHGMKAGFIGKVSDDQFGDFVVDYFNEQGIDTSNISRCQNGEKLGLTFTEMRSPIESDILMYRNRVADLQLTVDDIKEDYIRRAKAILISGTALAESPSREAALKAVMLARRVGTKIIFDIDYRNYNWKNMDEISIYCSIVAKESTVILGSREEFDLTEKEIKPGMSDEESAKLWHSYHARSSSSSTVCRDLLLIPVTARSSASVPSPCRPARALAAATAMPPDSCMAFSRAGRSSTAWSSVLPKRP